MIKDYTLVYAIISGFTVFWLFLALLLTIIKFGSVFYPPRLKRLVVIGSILCSAAIGFMAGNMIHNSFL